MPTYFLFKRTPGLFRKCMVSRFNKQCTRNGVSGQTIFKTPSTQHQKFGTDICNRITSEEVMMNFEISRILLVFLLNVISIGKVASYPGGAHVAQCESMQPGGRHGQPQNTPSPYMIIPDMIEYEPFVPVSSKLEY